MPRWCKSIYSWLMLQIYYTWLMQILLGCRQWWKMQELEPAFERLVWLEWNDRALNGLQFIQTELERLALRAETSQHPYTADQVSELHWIADWTKQLALRWEQHLAIST